MQGKELFSREPPVKVIIVDDHPLYLEAISRHVGRAFRGAEISAFSSLDGALDSLSNEPADLVVLDYSMPGMNGVEGLLRVLAVAGGAPVAVMSGVASRQDIFACIKAGARGFLPKTLEGRVVSDALSVIKHGGTYVPTDLLTNAAEVEAPTPPGEIDISTLSPREREMLRMVSAGASNKEIARQLELQEVTVKFYMTRLFRRLGVKNRSQAAVIATRWEK